jgi:hypothetical protein
MRGIHYGTEESRHFNLAKGAENDDYYTQEVRFGRQRRARNRLDQGSAGGTNNVKSQAIQAMEGAHTFG